MKTSIRQVTAHCDMARERALEFTRPTPTSLRHRNRWVLHARTHSVSSTNRLAALSVDSGENFPPAATTLHYIRCSSNPRTSIFLSPFSRSTALQSSMEDSPILGEVFDASLPRAGHRNFLARPPIVCISFPSISMSRVQSGCSSTRPRIRRKAAKVSCSFSVIILHLNACMCSSAGWTG